MPIKFLHSQSSPWPGSLFSHQRPPPQRSFPHSPFLRHQPSVPIIQNHSNQSITPTTEATPILLFLSYSELAFSMYNFYFLLHWSIFHLHFVLVVLRFLIWHVKPILLSLLILILYNHVGDKWIRYTVKREFQANQLHLCLLDHTSRERQRSKICLLE